MIEIFNKIINILKKIFVVFYKMFLILNFKQNNRNFGENKCRNLMHYLKKNV